MVVVADGGGCAAECPIGVTMETCARINENCFDATVDQRTRNAMPLSPVASVPLRKAQH